MKVLMMLTGFRESGEGNKSDGYSRKSNPPSKTAGNHFKYLLEKGFCIHVMKVLSV
jgi:hypothetical protein